MVNTTDSFQHPNNTECEGLYANTDSPLFGIVIFFLYGAGACVLVWGAVRNIKVGNERLRKAGKNKSKKVKTDVVTKVLYFMAASNFFFGVDAMATSFYFILCRGRDGNEALNYLKLVAALFVRSISYGLLIVSLIVLIVSWLEIVKSAQNMKINSQSGSQYRFASILSGIYIANSLFVMIFFFTGDDPDVNTDKKNLITILAAASVLVYMFGISIFAFIYGSRLHKLILSLSNKSSKSSKEDSTDKTLRTIHRLMMELSYFSLAFFLAINVLGVGFAMKASISITHLRFVI